MGTIKAFFSSLFSDIDQRILKFLIKLFALVLIWFLAYHFIMRPTQIPDKWLTQFIAYGAQWMINVVIHPTPLITSVHYDGIAIASLYQGDKYVFGIGDICNGLDLIATYACLIILLPGKVKRKLKYLVLGISAILLTDIIRATALYWIYYNYYKYFLFNHKYVFTILMYIVIFIGWALFVRKYENHEKN